MGSLLGHKITNSGSVETLINQLVGEVTQVNTGVNKVKGPDPEFKKNGDELVNKVGQLRGRALFYPYLGTGAGNGPYVELEDGSVKIDLINGIGIHILGHGHPQVMKAAVRGALSDIVIQGNLQANGEYLRFIEKLLSAASKKSRLKHAWVTTSGSMANENALKISRQKHTPARFIIAMESAFAGRTTLMTEISDNPAYKQGLPKYDEVLRVPYIDRREPDVARKQEKAFELFKEHVAKHEGQISAFMFEPMLGEGGYKVADRSYFLPMLEFCRQKKIAVWADEIQTFARTGELFCFETMDIGEHIDLCTIAKTAQVAATLWTEEYNPQPGLIAGTFAGSSAALAAGTEIIDILQNQNYFGPNGKIADIHTKFISMLNELAEGSCSGKLSDPSGLGLMIAVTPYGGDKDRVGALLKRMYENGLIAFGCGKDPMRIRFLIPAILEDQHIEEIKVLLEKSILEE